MSYVFYPSFTLSRVCKWHPLSSHVARFSEVTVVENRLMLLCLLYLLIYVGFGRKFFLYEDGSSFP